MKMTQLNAAFYCACNLATAARRDPVELQKAAKVLDNLDYIDDALKMFKEHDNDCFQAVQTLKEHHFLRKYRGQGGKIVKVYNQSEAESSWHSAKEYFRHIVDGNGQCALLSPEESRHVLAETGRILKQFAAGNHPQQQQKTA